MHKHNHDHHSHLDAHRHAITLNSKNKKKYIYVIFLNLFVSVFELILGVFANSMALISDAFHNFQDTASLIISYAAWIFSFKQPDEGKTYGYKRIEIIAAFLNSIFLIIICIYIIFESIKRFITPQHINSDIMVVVSLVAFLVNAVSAYFLVSDAKENINWKASYLHLIGDAAFSLAVFAGAIFIKYFNFYYLDPLLSVLMSVFIIVQTYRVLVKSFNILMQHGAELNYDEIKKDIEQLPLVKNIHHIHTWMSNENLVYFEAHVEVDDCMLSESCKILERIEEILKTKYGIYHTTLQLEVDKCKNKDIIHKDI